MAMSSPNREIEGKLARLKKLREEKEILDERIKLTETSLSEILDSEPRDEDWRKINAAACKGFLNMIDSFNKEAKGLKEEEATLREEVDAYYRAHSSTTNSGESRNSPGASKGRHSPKAASNKADSQSKRMKLHHELFPEQVNKNDVPVAREVLPQGSRVRAKYPGTEEYRKARIVGNDSSSTKETEATHYLVKFKNEQTVEETGDGTAVWRIPVDEVLPRN